jgi:hypothetical protein
MSEMCERGVSLSTLLLAEGNEAILGNTSFIACPKEMVKDISILERAYSFFSESRVFLYLDASSLSSFVASTGIQWIYYQIHGEQEVLPSEACSTFVHAVFTTKFRFGTLYVPISDWLNHHNGTNYPVLPLIAPRFLGIQDSLRSELGIPPSAIVFGGIGGRHSFNIPFLRDTVISVAKRRPDIYFLFLNFEPFCEIPNVIFFPKNTDLDYKERFINACDAMLHARGDGETFGIACAEFSVKNKPVISWKPGLLYMLLFHLFYIFRALGMPHLLPSSLFGIRPHECYAMAHLDYLGDKCIRYTTKSDLVSILMDLARHKKFTCYDCYSNRFSPEVVLAKFKDLIDSHGTPANSLCH